MNPKVSDFKLAASALRQACRAAELPFVDVSLCFSDRPKEGELHIGSSDSLGYTLYKIVEQYVEQLHLFSKPLFQNDEQKRLFVIHFASSVRNLFHYPDLLENETRQLAPSRLYSIPLVWGIMRDIICPLFEKQAQNILLISAEAPAIDIAKFYNKDPAAKIDEPFIFCNEETFNPIAQNAFILMAAIEAHGLNAREVMSVVFGGQAANKFIGLSKLAFVKDEDAEHFMTLLMKCLDFTSDDFPHLSYSSDRLGKEAQLGSQSNPQWWYMGLPEKMLEPVRGYDWDVYENLNPWIEEFWKEVKEIEAKKKQGEGIPLDLLLRLKDSDSPKTDSTRTLQYLLRQQRIWN